ncbi:hypothetical protein K7432_007115 [Basidiobolus ranarum]|uniref:Phosphatases II n=1 Tax=Basidiobolus ranarum TaxID=34480 RepID=A0ABR2W0U9_9FUNG
MPAEIRARSKHTKTATPQTLVSFVEYKNIRFLILDCPTNSNLPAYFREFCYHHVTDVVRVCEPTYSAEPLVAAGMNVHDWPYPDGSVPPPDIIQQWLKLVKNSSTRNQQGETSTIAIHCVAGLGRAPVLVAIALIDKGMDSLNAIEFVRSKRKGAFNNRQIKYLDSYRRQKVPVSFKKSLRKIFKFSQSV